MGGEQAANVLAEVKAMQCELKGETFSDADRSTLKAPIEAKFAEESDAFYATARLWDDGIIDPIDTRKVIALSLEAALQAPIEETKVGVFRM